MALIVRNTDSAITYNYSRGDQFDTLTVNNTTFAIFRKPLQNSTQSQDLTLAADCNCVFLESMEAEHDINIKAVNILALGSFSAKNGSTRIHAKNFYGVGVELKGGNFSVQTDENLIVAGLHGDCDHLYTKGKKVHFLGNFTERMHEIATEIKMLFSQGIDQTDIMPFARALLKAAQTLNDSHEDLAITSESLQPLLLIDI